MRTLLLSTALLLASLASAQCLCGDMIFSITLDGYAQDSARYLVRKVELNGGQRDTYGDRLSDKPRLPYPFETRHGILRLDQPTRGGTESVTWEVFDVRTGRLMRLTALHMGVDMQLEAGVIPFTQGTYVFDWSAIPSAVLPEKDRLEGRTWQPYAGHLENPDLIHFHRGLFKCY